MKIKPSFLKALVKHISNFQGAEKFFWTSSEFCNSFAEKIRQKFTKMFLTLKLWEVIRNNEKR